MRTRTIAAALSIALLGTSACSPDQPGTTTADVSATKSSPNPRRHELDPLTTRFPELRSPVSASWVSGDVGDTRVPGPFRYGLDAVVELTPDAAAALTTRYHPTRSDARPEVWPTLAGDLPPGGYLVSDALDAAFSINTAARVYLAEQQPVVVITATGE